MHKLTKFQIGLTDLSKLIIVIEGQAIRYLFSWNLFTWSSWHYSIPSMQA